MPSKYHQRDCQTRIFNPVVRARLGINLRFLGDSACTKYLHHCLAQTVGMQELSKLANSMRVISERDGEKGLCFCNLNFNDINWVGIPATQAGIRRSPAEIIQMIQPMILRVCDSPARTHVMSIVHWTAVGHQKRRTSSV